MLSRSESRTSTTRPFARPLGSPPLLAFLYDLGKNRVAVKPPGQLLPPFARSLGTIRARLTFQLGDLGIQGINPTPQGV
jgi:hypothetical protein